MRSNIAEIESKVWAKLEAAGFEPMEEFNAVLPAHNPPYVRAMRMLRKALPEIPLVAAFETGFHENIAG